MKKNLIQSGKITVVVIMLLGIFTLNFSLAIDEYIEIPGLDKADLSTSACFHVDIPGQNRQYIRSEEPTKIYNVDSCKVGFRFPFSYDAPMTMTYPKKDIIVTYKLIEYILPQPLRLVTKRKGVHKDYQLRFMAVSAPQWESNAGVTESYALDSRTPFSLQNAIRLGVQSTQNPESNWTLSNWYDPKLVNESVFLMNYYNEEKSVFEERLEKIKPQILFIGSMTLSFPGAIELAKIAKQKFGDKIFVVLGGKHVIETFYLKDNEVKHHYGSPVLLMYQGKIPKVFDLAVSGDGEEVIQMIGDVLGKEILSNNTLKNFSYYQNYFETARGNFILSWIEQNEIKTFVQQNNPLDYDNLPSPVSLFGVNNRFTVFEKKFTAHAYSDMGKGCVFNCFFCSERSAINGPVIQTGSPAMRLWKQFRDASHYDESMSAFVEDSILLMGLPKHLNELARLLEQQPINIVFGGQFTVDNLLNPKVQESIKRLAKVGLTYIYTGMETGNDEVAVGMSKNTTKKVSWMDRNEEAIAFVTNLGLKYGISILWGLGETQVDRLHQIDVVHGWQEKYHNPVCVSPNWATQHPLFNQSDFNYIEWGTETKSDYLAYFVQLFGEASEKYIIHGDMLPTIIELKDLQSNFEKLTIQNV
jgi:B12-binding domain/radical SAM domain protein